MNWLTANPEVSFVCLVLLGAIAHWAKKAANGDVRWNPVDYWLADHPGRTGGTLFALALAIWSVIGTETGAETLHYLDWRMLVFTSFPLGWAIDSGVNKGTTMVVAKPSVRKKRQSGRASVSMCAAIFLILLASISISGCAQLTDSFKKLPSMEHCQCVSYLRTNAGLDIKCRYVDDESGSACVANVDD